ncbi:MAG: ATP-binding cassette domain-containing protein, partial [Pyrinomonadaceae bacterium]
DQGELLGVVGESGCGKSVTSLSIMRLVAAPGRIVGGEIIFDNRDLLKLKEDEMRAIRGDDIAMIFQDPMTSLNPVYTVGEQIAEALRLHRNLSRRAAREAAVGDTQSPSRTARRAGVTHISSPAACGGADDCDGSGLRPQAVDRRRADRPLT